jgi:hypothetical protein
MGAALVVDVGSATNPGAGGAACAFTAPSTNVVRNSALTSPVQLVGMWRNGVTKGLAKVTSPKIVPVANGIFLQGAAGSTGRILTDPPYQVLTPQDILTVTVGGGAAESDQVALQSYYSNLPGVSMTLKSPGDIVGNTAFTFSWPVAAVGGAIGAQGNTVITTTVDSSTANAWYAVLGYTVDALVTAVGITGVDTSQTFCGGPGLLDFYKTSRFFIDMSNQTGLPCIPLFNAANKANTNITVVDVAAATAVNVSLILAELNAGYTP